MTQESREEAVAEMKGMRSASRAPNKRVVIIGDCSRGLGKRHLAQLALTHNVVTATGDDLDSLSRILGNEDMNKRINKQMVSLDCARGGKSYTHKLMMARYLNDEESPEDQNIHNYSWLVNEWELIEAKISKLSATRRAEVVREYERTHNTEKDNE